MPDRSPPSTMACRARPGGLERVLFGGYDEADLVPGLLEHAADEQDALGLVINLFDDE